MGYAILTLRATGEALNFSGAHFLKMSKLKSPNGANNNPDRH